MTTEERKQIDKLIEEKMQEQESLSNVPAQEEENNNMLPSEHSKGSSFEMPNFIPQIDKDKEISEQASDVVQVLGAQRASQDNDFMDKVSKNFQEGVFKDQEVKDMKKARLLEEEYFLKWQDVLSFVLIKSPHGMLFMQIMTVIAMFIYVPMRIIGMAVKSIGMLGDFVNEIFNSIFGGKGKYLRDKEGNVIINPQTKKPYVEQRGYNLLAKVLFGIIIGGLGLALIFVFVRMFTGFDIFLWFRSIL